VCLAHRRIDTNPESTTVTQYNSELISQLSKPLTVEENLDLIPLAAGGDTDARDRMIEGNMALVIAKVDGYLSYFPQYVFLRDDLTSAGFVALVEAVDNIVREGTKIKAPVDYMGVAILRSIGDLAETDGSIHIPRETQRLATARGERITPLTPCSGALETCATNDAESVFDMRDLIASCCSCDQERTFVKMREAGYKLREIAVEVNMPLSSLHVMKEDLYRRVLAKSGLRDTKKGRE
jgi:hypothetical protein